MNSINKYILINYLVSVSKVLCSMWLTKFFFYAVNKALCSMLSTKYFFLYCERSTLFYVVNKSSSFYVVNNVLLFIPFSRIQSVTVVWYLQQSVCYNKQLFCYYGCLDDSIDQRAMLPVSKYLFSMYLNKVIKLVSVYYKKKQKLNKEYNKYVSDV